MVPDSFSLALQYVLLDVPAATYLALPEPLLAAWLRPELLTAFSRAVARLLRLLTPPMPVSTDRGEKILLLAYARSCQHMGESETAINAAPRAVSELRKSNFIPRELSSFLKESVKTAHFNLIAASL